MLQRQGLLSIKPKPFARRFSCQFSYYPNRVSLVQPFLPWLYGMVHVCEALSAFGFDTLVRHYVPDLFFFSLFKSSLVSS